MVFDIISNIITVLSAIAVPIVVIIIGNNFTKKLELEKGLQDKRVPLYQDLLEPLIVIFAPDQAFEKVKKYQGKSNSEIALDKIQTIEYNQKMFEMSLIAPDPVIRAFNNYYQYMYKHPGTKDIQTMMHLWGTILLEIRKSMGNSKTDLHPLEMLEWKLNDITSFKIDGKYKLITDEDN